MANVKENDAALQTARKKAECKQTIAKVEAAIREQQEKIIAETVPANPGLFEKKADILARLAVGEATESDLAAINAEIAKHEEATKVSELKIGPAREAVEGLTRRLQQERETLRKLSAAHEQARRAFLLDQAEQVGADFVAAADVLHALLARLCALNSLMGREENLLAIDQRLPYVIPNLRRLQAFAGAADRRYLHEASELVGSGKADSILNEEKKRLADMGIEL